MNMITAGYKYIYPDQQDHFDLVTDPNALSTSALNRILTLFPDECMQSEVFTTDKFCH